jgi:hypothetical protein
VRRCSEEKSVNKRGCCRHIYDVRILTSGRGPSTILLDILFSNNTRLELCKHERIICCSVPVKTHYLKTYV